ncbi:MAG: bifunctional UDP-N-acetylglucosamine diphosphorylase/glucosamine-1-phosphate N-acetyltransferase GlmU [Alphaproteobacteria bacterium]|nr:bifunctional UDP-N-acetylglucosamine diphosphorylase/glucosamine-1-phosphate N-acetyltransferase GlmU [Alphaproteobacteria bacterium]
MSKDKLAVVILAAGKGSRMKSDKPKVMHELAGLPMINWLLNTVEQLSPEKIVVVVGMDMPDLEATVKPHETVVQEVQNGTGGALQAAMPALKGFDGDILVLLGDTPLISLQAISDLVAARRNNGLSVLGVELEDPTGYGRLLMDESNILQAIRDHKDASEEERKIKLCNTGAFCLDGARIENWIFKITDDNAQGEYYITDLPEIAAQDSVKTSVAIAQNAAEVMGCNTRLDLANMEARAQNILRERFIEHDVVMHDPESVYLHHDTQIAAGTIIEPSVFFGPNVKVGENVHIKAFCHFEECEIGKNTTVGPFARLRPGAKIGEDVRIGNFVEIKKSSIGDRSKISHLGYVGDCEMGTDVNFGCGAVTVNYDGFDKHQTVIGDGVMVGSNVNLIAPVTLGDGSFVAAGTTLTTDVPADALSVERGEATVKEGWAARNREEKKKA